jgi:hypothetical protein
MAIMVNETVWAWIRSNGKVFRVISNPFKGTIEVLNEKGETLIRKTNLSRRQVELVEKNLLHLVAQRLNGRHKDKPEPDESYDPMVS